MLLALLSIATLTTGSPGEVNRCLTCHPANVAGHLSDWEQSVHARAGITCHSCHPADVDPFFHQPADDSAATILKSCHACHADITAQFVRSRHYSVVGEEQPTCATCHSTAGGSVLDESALVERCRVCHTEPHVERATELRRLLRQVALAHAVVREAIERRRKRGDGVAAYVVALRAIEATLPRIALEWHRFNLDTAERHSQQALHALADLHRQMGDG